MSQPLLVQDADGSLVPYADLGSLDIKGWNELVVDGRGNAYINGGKLEPHGGEAYTPGFHCAGYTSGRRAAWPDNIAFPNGMAVTSDNSTLIIAESYATQLTAFDIEADGSLTNRRAWAKLGENDNPDGICIDTEGAVWSAGVSLASIVFGFAKVARCRKQSISNSGVLPVRSAMPTIRSCSSWLRNGAA